MSTAKDFVIKEVETYIIGYECGLAFGRADRLAGRPESKDYSPGTPQYDGYRDGYDAAMEKQS